MQEKKFSDRLQETLRKYNNRAIETAQVIEELIEMAKDFQSEMNSEADLGLNADEIAFYDALANNESAVRMLGDEILKKIGKQIDKVIALNVSDEEIIERITGRRVSKTTGKIYHIKYNPPVDENEEDIYQREDDNETAVETRLKAYKEQTSPLFDYYKNTMIKISS